MKEIFNKAMFLFSISFGLLLWPSWILADDVAEAEMIMAEERLDEIDGEVTPTEANIEKAANDLDDYRAFAQGIKEIKEKSEKSWLAMRAANNALQELKTDIYKDDSYSPKQKNKIIEGADQVIEDMKKSQRIYWIIPNKKAAAAKTLADANEKLAQQETMLSKLKAALNSAKNRVQEIVSQQRNEDDLRKQRKVSREVYATNSKIENTKRRITGIKKMKKALSNIDRSGSYHKMHKVMPTDREIVKSIVEDGPNVHYAIRLPDE